MFDVTQVAIISKIGGILIFLVFIHLLSDWMIQNDVMARRKSDESPWLLVIHSFVYAIIFIPILIYLFGNSIPMIVSSFLALVMSHGAIDTYAPVWLWARFIRRPPEMKNDPIKGFMSWASSPYGMILTNGIDQLMHVCFLVLISIMAVVLDMHGEAARTLGLVIFSISIGLAALSVATILLLWQKKQRKNSTIGYDYELDGNSDRPSMPSQHDE